MWSIKLRWISVLASALFGLLTIIGTVTASEKALLAIHTDLDNRTSFGTGFYITDQGHILTCYHVVANSNRIRVFELDSSKRFDSNLGQVVVERIAPNLDLAILKLTGSVTVPFHLKIHANPSEILPQDNIKAFGHPQRTTFHQFYGRVSKKGFIKSEEIFDRNGHSIFNRSTDLDLLPIDVTIGEGMSGGPVIWRDKVVGVLSGSLNASTGRTLAWAIPTNYVKNWKRSEFFHVVNMAPKNLNWPKFRIMAEHWKGLHSSERSFIAKKDSDDTLENSIGMKLRLIPAGKFEMGTPKNNLLAVSHEHPQRTVRITEPFYMGVHEVTVKQFAEFISATKYQPATNGNGFDHKTGKLKDGDFSWRKTGFEQGENHPVVNVSWYDADEFCNWLSKKEAKRYRLPTEAEWEYACRAGSRTLYSFGDSSVGMEGHGNVADVETKKVVKNPTYLFWSVNKNSDGYAFTSPVGSFKANKFGLFDMHGNVFEWCHDWFSPTYYRKGENIDPTGPLTGSGRVLRSGSWLAPPLYCRSADRRWISARDTNCWFGFRVVREQ